MTAIDSLNPKIYFDAVTSAQIDPEDSKPLNNPGMANYVMFDWLLAANDTPTAVVSLWKFCRGLDSFAKTATFALSPGRGMKVFEILGATVAFTVDSISGDEAVLTAYTSMR